MGKKNDAKGKKRKKNCRFKFGHECKKGLSDRGKTCGQGKKRLPGENLCYQGKRYVMREKI